MKKLIGTDTGSYIFDASAKTITFAGYSASMQQILGVINATSQSTIYRPITDGYGASLASNTMSLEYDTTSMNDADDLIIWIWDKPTVTDVSYTKIVDQNNNVIDSEQDSVGTNYLKVAEIQRYYTTKINVSGSISYIGKASPSTSVSASGWQIQKVDESETPDITITWADGVSTFTKIWNNRLTYNYS